jgi:hypothetical protein
MLTTDTNQWRKLSARGRGPSARSHHTASLIGHTIYVFGGNDGFDDLNDLYSYNLRKRSSQLSNDVTRTDIRCLQLPENGDSTNARAMCHSQDLNTRR